MAQDRAGFLLAARQAGADAARGDLQRLQGHALALFIAGVEQAALDIPPFEDEDVLLPIQAGPRRAQPFFTAFFWAASRRLSR